MATPTRSARVSGQPTPLPSNEHALLMREWLELLPTAAIFLGADGRVTYANARAHELFCRPAGRLVGLTRAQCIKRGIFDPAYLDKIDAAGTQTRYFISNVEEHQVRVGRRNLTIRATYNPVALHGIYRGVFGVFEDITESREAAHLRDDLIHMMFHDMQHPLAAIMLNLDGLVLLDDEDRLTDQQRRFIDTAKLKVEQMSGMFTKMVDIGKLEQQRLPLTLVTFDMNDLVEGVLRETFALRFDAAGKRLLFAPSTHLCPVTGDVGLLQRVVSNLVDNALKFTPEAGTVEVRTARGSDRKSVRVHVRDEGPGVPVKFRRVIFEKYRQVRMRKAGVHTGIGLGLAFCKLAVDAHGGTIAVKSRRAGGSNFAFTIPCTPEAAE